MIPGDDDTKVLYRTEHVISGMRCFEEKWSWDGFLGNSVIFPREDEVDGFSDDQLIDTVVRFIDSTQTSAFCVKRTSDFIFVNFVIEEECNDLDGDLFLKDHDLGRKKKRPLEYVRKRNHRD